LYIQRSLSPAKISSIRINDEDRRASVFLKPDQVSLAIGKGGQNIKLASRLVGLEIDVFREQEEYEEDISLDEFSDEIDAWVIEELKRIGLDTAKSVLAVSREDLVRRTELEEETVDDLLAIIRQEFDTDNS
jgi:N utilization substance protein A